jgi:hypothetical protein
MCKIRIPILILAITTLQACALALPVASGISSVSTEIRLKKMEERMTENEKLTDYLIEKLSD